MAEILIPLTFEDLPVRPALVGRPKISDDIQQTAALLVGWDKTTRRLVSVTPSGVLYTAQPRVKGIINYQSTGVGDTYQGGNIDTSEAVIKAKDNNGGRVWVNFGAAAAVDVGYPLDAGEPLVFSIHNLSNMHLYFENADDWVIILYTH